MPKVFEKAIQENNCDDVHSYISCGKKIPVDICNEKSQTGLMIACEYKAATCVEEFIDNNANLEATDTSGWRPIHFSAQSGSLEIVKMLIKAGAKIDAENNEGDRALHIAAKHNFADIVETLIEKGVKIDAINNKGKTALLIAAKHNFVDIVDCLLYNKANEKFVNTLYYTIRKNNVETAKCIFSHSKSKLNNTDEKFLDTIRKFFDAVEIEEEILCFIEDHGSLLGKSY